LARRVECAGIGLHSGQPITMVLHPAPAGSGIRFRRIDLASKPVIAARHDNVSDLVLCTTVADAKTGAKVATVEHLLAALAGLGVDNVRVDLDGPEVPVMDGSAEPFVAAIERVGLVEQNAARRYIRVLKAVEVRDGERVARLEPANRFTISMAIDFESPAIGRQDVEVDLDDGAFVVELAGARTFGFEHEVAQLRDKGLARGGSLENAVVISGDRVLNEEGLRFDDEFVRHKALDAVGDLYLAGAPLLARFHGERTGHALNNRLLHALFADATAWCFDTLQAGARLRPVAKPVYAREGALAAAE
jgi:UDP-3-O-[3-hydroxymyristoyl] N-acetylglucosamine deacetylase